MLTRLGSRLVPRGRLGNRAWERTFCMWPSDKGIGFLGQAKNKGIPQFSLDCLILRELVKSAHAVHSIKANQAQQTLVNSSAVNKRLKFVHLNRRLQKTRPYEQRGSPRCLEGQGKNIMGNNGIWTCLLSGNVRTTKLLAEKSLLGYCHGDKLCNGTETEKAAVYISKVRGNNLSNIGLSLFKIQCSSIKLVGPSTINSTWH